MENRLPGDLRQSRVAGQRTHFIHYDRIGNQCLGSVLPRQQVGQKSTEIRCMGTVAGGPQIVLHHFVDSIHSPLQRVEQTAAADHGT